MFGSEFFHSQSWNKILKAYSDVTDKSPVVVVHCLAGNSFTVFKMKPWKSFLVLEVYSESNKFTSIVLLPYQQIQYLEFREEAEIKERFGQKEHIGFKIPDEE